MRCLIFFFSFAYSLVCIEPVHARLNVCNHTDLVLLVAVGFDNAETNKIQTEGWWRIYPGSCEVPVDLSQVKGSYFLRAESNPVSTMTDDAFDWGAEKSLCIKSNDFDLEGMDECRGDARSAPFNRIGKSGSNANTANIYHPQRRYLHLFRTKVAGIQRLLSILGYEIGTIDGVMGEKTMVALNEVATTYNISGYDLDKMYPILENVIAQAQAQGNVN